MTQIFISTNPDNLRRFNPAVTIEAEYGEAVVEGARLTLAHHGSRSANPAPCLAENFCAGMCPSSIGISHIDLDTLGGIMAVLGCKPQTPEFWGLAAWVDVNGVHHLPELNPDVLALRQLHTWHAFSQAHRVFAPRDGSIADVTGEVLPLVDHLIAICNADMSSPLLLAGDEFAAQEAKLNEESFAGMCLATISRKSEHFVNHLYSYNNGRGFAKAVVVLNTKTGSLTVSFADPIPGLSCRDIVQRFWRDKDEHGNFLAGGHDGIAGSPRGMVCSERDLGRLTVFTDIAIHEGLVKAEWAVFRNRFCGCSHHNQPCHSHHPTAFHRGGRIVPEASQAS